MTKRMSATDIDQRVLGHATCRWQKVAKIVGLIAIDLGEENWPGESFVAARIKWLARSGRLESQGNLDRMRYSEVRLPRTFRRPRAQH